LKNQNLESLTMENNTDWFGDQKPKESPAVSSEIIPKKDADKTDKGDSRKFWEWSLSIGFACLLLGMVVSLLFKTYKKEGLVTSLYGSRKDLAVMVKYLQTEREKLQADLSHARQTLSDYEETASRGKNESTTIKRQLNLVRQEAGLTAVRGPGIITRLSDSPIKPKEGDDPNYYIVHDIDLLALVNELWASGAEAISINGQRVVMTSAIRCVGPTITVNAVRLSPPYIVKVIGPQDNLETGLKYTGGFMDSMSPNFERGVSVKISRENDLSISPFKGSLVNRFARTYRPEKEAEKKK